MIGSDGVAHYDLSKEGFSDIMKQCAQNGALLLGGCCGTNPEFIAAMKQLLQP